MQHGQFEIEQQHGFMKVSLIGDFNREGAAALSRALINQLEQSTSEKLCLLFNLLEFTGGTPCAYDEHEKLNKWLLSEGLFAKAMVYNNKLLSDIADQRMPSRRPEQFQVFSCEKEAASWLIEHIH